MSIEAENIAYKQEIAKLAGIEPDLVSREDAKRVLSLCNLMNDGQYGIDLLLEPLADKYFGKFTSLSDRLDDERSMRLIHLFDAFADSPAVNYTYGNFFNSYLAALKNVKEKFNSTDHRALLIGAETVTTVNEFTRTVRKIFPAAHCLIVDVDGVDTKNAAIAQSADFVCGDAFHLPFSESIDSIHTNFLTNLALEGSDLKDALYGRSVFAKQAYKALRSNGSIMLLEHDVHEDGFLLKREYRDLLYRAGFKNIQITYPAFINDRRAVDRFLSGQGAQEIDQILNRKWPEVGLFITGQKI